MVACRLRPLVAVGVLSLVSAGCSTGVPEADRAIFVNACSGVTGATEQACACAYDDLASGGVGSNRVIQESIDELRSGRVPRRVTRAVARCTTP
jgi:hypothetical protein